MGEEFLSKVRGVCDGHTRGAREAVEELLGLYNLELCAVPHPGLLHVGVVLALQVDVGNELRLGVEQSSLLRKVDDLERLELTGQSSGRYVGVDVEDLTVQCLAHGAQDGQFLVLEGIHDLPLVDVCDVADVLPLVLVQVVGLQGASGDGAGGHAPVPLERHDQVHVCLEEQLACNAQRLLVRDANAVDEVGLDARVEEQLVHLGAGAVDDDRVQADGVELLEGKA